MEAEQEAPFLPEKKKTYHDGCPGCRSQRARDVHRGRLAVKELAIAWLCSLAGALPIASLFPFLYFMIRDFHVAKSEEDIGFYAGFVGASFMIGRCLFSTPWGMVADRIGRKPVLIVSLTATVVFNIMFGLSMNYLMAIISRLVTGAFNCTVSTTRVYAVEVSQPHQRATAMAIVTSSWGVGFIVGPAIGGYLAQPAENYPQVFSPESLFARFPYLLPCLCTSSVAAIAAIGAFWLPETLHKHAGKIKEDQTIEAIEPESCLCITKENAESSAVKSSIFRNWPFISAIIINCVYCVHDMGYNEIFPLWAESDRSYGGLSYTTRDVGQVLAITGFCLVFCQLFIFGRVINFIGSVKACRYAALLAFLVLSTYPAIGSLTGLALSVILTSASVAKFALSVCILTSIYILENDAVTQDQRGAANGLALSGDSISRAIGPAVGGAILSWSQKRHSTFLPGSQMVFFLLNVPLILTFIMTFKPFLALPAQVAH